MPNCLDTHDSRQSGDDVVAGCPPIIDDCRFRSIGGQDAHAGGVPQTDIAQIMNQAKGDEVKGRKEGRKDAIPRCVFMQHGFGRIMLMFWALQCVVDFADAVWAGFEPTGTVGLNTGGISRATFVSSREADYIGVPWHEWYGDYSGRVTLQGSGTIEGYFTWNPIKTATLAQVKWLGGAIPYAYNYVDWTLGDGAVTKYVLRFKYVSGDSDPACAAAKQFLYIYVGYKPYGESHSDLPPDAWMAVRGMYGLTDAADESPVPPLPLYQEFWSRPEPQERKEAVESAAHHEGGAPASQPASHSFLELASQEK